MIRKSSKATRAQPNPTTHTKRRKSALVLALGLLVFVSGVAAVRTEPERAAAQPEAAPGVDVVVVRATKGSLEAPVRLTGEVLAQRRAEISAEAHGRVLEMARRLGDRVAKGDELARLDGSKNALAIRQARARVVQAEIAYEQANRKRGRSQSLFDGEKISVEKYDDAVFAYRRAKAERELRRAELASLERASEDFSIRAPFDAYISEVHVQVGDFVSAGSPAFSLIETSGVKASFPVPAEHIASFSRDAIHSVEIPALGRSFQGRIAAIAQEADPRSRTFEMEIDLDPVSDLRTGMIARMSTTLPTGREGLFVPASAVVEKFGGSFLFVVQDGRAREVPVEIEQRSGPRVAISGGLPEGARVITSGQHRLADGARVATAAEELAANGLDSSPLLR